MSIPQTILSQLGGGGFALLTGSKNFTTSHEERALTFQPGANPKSVTHIEIILEPSDTYRMRFSRLNSRTCELATLAEHTEVYAEDLLDIFEQETGLFATLGKR